MPFPLLSRYSPAKLPLDYATLPLYLPAMWTTEQARQFAQVGAAASVESRRRKAEGRTVEPSLRTEPFTAKRLMRVRRQLNMIDRMIENESDPQKIDRLASASMRLSDQEFALSGRPKPGPTKSLPPRRRPAPGADAGSPDLA